MTQLMIRILCLLLLAGFPVSVGAQNVKVKLIVDANRDGVITQEDIEGEEKKYVTPGIVACNCDDDDRDGERDCDDSKINGDEDLKDLAPMKLIVMSDSKINEVLVEIKSPPGRYRLFTSAGQEVEGGVWRIDGERLAIGPNEFDFLIEATGVRLPDSQPLLLVSARDNSKRSSSMDVAAFMAAPLILRPGSVAPETVFVREYPGRNDELLEGLRAASKEADCKLHVVPGDAPYPANHIWLQDAVEIGETSTPTARMTVAMPSNRNRDVDLFVRDEMLGPDVGYVRVGEYREKYALGEGGVSWIDWYGNLEATPPLRGHPFGRILYGVDEPNEAGLNPEVVAMLEAQGVQEPLPLDVGWLTIKHVDEMVGFVAGDKPFEFWTLVPDTGVAIDILRRLSEEGHGSAAVFDVFEQGATVDSLLADEEFISANERLQKERINPMIGTLVRELGLKRRRVIRLPALYKDGGLSRMPNVVNCLVMGEVIAMADPNGPVINGEDAIQSEVLKLMERTGASIHFVDDRQYHKWSGNVHCATNAIRAPLDVNWWEVEMKGRKSR